MIDTYIEFLDHQVCLSYGQIWFVDGLDFGTLALKLFCRCVLVAVAFYFKFFGYVHQKLQIWCLYN
jgi:hypothetical protein